MVSQRIETKKSVTRAGAGGAGVGWELTDGGHMAGGEVVLRESQQDAALADRGVANDDQLD